MLWYDMIWYDMLWYDMIWYGMIWYVWYGMVWYDMIRYMINDMIWYNFVLNCLLLWWQGAKDGFYNFKQNVPSFLKLRKFLGLVKHSLSLYPQTSISDETIFKYNKAADKFWTFSSHKYYRSRLHDMYVAIRKNGRSKKGLKTNILSKTTWFLHINK